MKPHLGRCHGTARQPQDADRNDRSRCVSTPLGRNKGVGQEMSLSMSGLAYALDLLRQYSAAREARSVRPKSATVNLTIQASTRTGNGCYSCNSWGNSPSNNNNSKDQGFN
eukprot:4923730-Amphidinium_carterae.1